MHEVTTRQRARFATPLLAVAPIVVLIVGLTAGCGQTKNWLQGSKTADAEPMILGAPETDLYISEIYRLVSGDPATQAEIFADASAAAQLTPDPSTRLRFALVLATPGHSGADSNAAQGILRDLLSQQELMTPGEISLATIGLRQVEEQIMLGAETSRLRSENTRAASTEEAAVAQRMADIEAENRRLKDSLTEAEAKLEAITSIERSIREQ
jgi:hypothetical protein